MTQPALTRTVARLEAELGGRLLDRLAREIGRRALGSMRAGGAALCLLAAGPGLAWLPLCFLDRLCDPRLRALPTEHGRRRYRTGRRGPRAVPPAE